MNDIYLVEYQPAHEDFEENWHVDLLHRSISLNLKRLIKTKGRYDDCPYIVVGYGATREECDEIIKCLQGAGL